jgi:putative flavoprotein involved in K+ transport
VIVATGANQRPYTPILAASIAPQMAQLHSSEYRRPAQLPEGRVLVAGAGNSGTQIALELSDSGRRVLLAGPDVGALPRRILGRDLYDWIWHTLLRTSNESVRGRRRMQARRFAADPLIGISQKAFEKPGLCRAGRIVAVRAGMPVLDDGSAVRDVSATVWCTGFRPDYSWIELPVFSLDGHPIHRRGVAVDAPGLAFVGMRYQYRIRSALLGGVGDDAAHVAERIVAHLREMPLTPWPYTAPATAI